MKKTRITENVYWVGAVDWDRRLFDSLIPLPEGTTYNAYLVEGSEKIALLDAVDPSMLHVLMGHLADVPRIDYIISHHTEQDHSGTIPNLLERYPDAKVVASDKAKQLLTDHLKIPQDKIIVVQDGQTLSLGDRALKFIYTPWVHWPETIVSYLEPEKILFTCDLFGSHYASSDIFVRDQAAVYEAAKRYYAEIMMPFANLIDKHIQRLEPLEINMIAPSHGPIYQDHTWIVSAYRRWVSPQPENTVLLAFVTMHDSTKLMAEYLTGSLAELGIKVDRFNLPTTDLGKLAISLVDAATIIIGTPTVLGGPHPLAAYAALVINALKPKARYFSVIGSYGWGGKAVETLKTLVSGLKVEHLQPVLARGLPKENDYTTLQELAKTIAEKHRQLQLM